MNVDYACIGFVAIQKRALKMSALFFCVLREVLRSKQALDVQRLQEAELSHSRFNACVAAIANAGH